MNAQTRKPIGRDLVQLRRAPQTWAPHFTFDTRLSSRCRERRLFHRGATSDVQGSTHPSRLRSHSPVPVQANQRREMGSARSRRRQYRARLRGNYDPPRRGARFRQWIRRPRRLLLRAGKGFLLIAGVGLAGGSLWLAYLSWADGRCVARMQEWSDRMELLERCREVSSPSCYFLLLLFFLLTVECGLGSLGAVWRDGSRKG